MKGISALCQMQEHDVIAKKSSWRVGLTVCYDLRFPALYEKLCERPRTQEQGAEEEATTKMEEESSQLWGAELVLVPPPSPKTFLHFGGRSD
jgi:predicted amidohydrolase